MRQLEPTKLEETKSKYRNNWKAEWTCLEIMRAILFTIATRNKILHNQLNQEYERFLQFKLQTDK